MQAIVPFPGCGMRLGVRLKCVRNGSCTWNLNIQEYKKLGGLRCGNETIGMGIRAQELHVYRRDHGSVLPSL